MNRRKFFGVLGISAAATPLAAKSVLEEETLTLATSRTLPIATGALSAPGMPVGEIDEHRTRVKMADHIRMWGIPAHVLEQAREESKWVYSLDFDIAAKRSWSLAAKVHEQRQRNLQRKLDHFKNSGRVAEIKRVFAKTFGFEFLSW